MSPSSDDRAGRPALGHPRQPPGHDPDPRRHQPGRGRAADHPAHAREPADGEGDRACPRHRPADAAHEAEAVRLREAAAVGRSLGCAGPLHADARPAPRRAAVLTQGCGDGLAGSSPDARCFRDRRRQVRAGGPPMRHFGTPCATVSGRVPFRHSGGRASGGDCRIGTIRGPATASVSAISARSAVSRALGRWHASRYAPRCVTPAASRDRRVVLLIGAGAAWPDELLKLLPDDEWAIERLSDLEDVPDRLARGPVCAILTTPRQWSGRELQLLRECRARAPETAYLVMAEDPAAPGPQAGVRARGHRVRPLAEQPRGRAARHPGYARDRRVRTRPTAGGRRERQDSCRRGVSMESRKRERPPGGRQHASRAARGDPRGSIGGSRSSAGG